VNLGASVASRTETCHGYQQIRGDLARLGVRRGSVLLVQASLRSVAPAEGDPELVANALLDALGPNGTLVVPTFTSLNSTTSRAHKLRVSGMTRQQVESYIVSIPVFDPLTSPSEGMGALAEYVRNLPGSIRSAHPHTSFAAVGPLAKELMEVHDLASHLGPRSPVARLYEFDADSLLLGLDYNQGCTMIHFAEYLVAQEAERRGLQADRRGYRARTYSAEAPDKWVDFYDLDLDDGDFKQIGEAFERSMNRRFTLRRRTLRRGPIGSADSRLVRSRDVVDFAKMWMMKHRDFNAPKPADLAVAHA
jgi:aminoglycoside 3-N-acetyltransferase